MEKAQQLNENQAEFQQVVPVSCSTSSSSHAFTLDKYLRMQTSEAEMRQTGTMRQMCLSGMRCNMSRCSSPPRLVLANTEQLHERIEQLCSRIRELESALRGAQAQISDEEHPLLRSDLLGLKSPHASYPVRAQDLQPPFVSAVGAGVAHISMPNNTLDSTGPTKKMEDENLIDAFGTLSIRENGETHFLGQTARSEYLIRALAKPQKNFLYTSGTRLSNRIMHGAHYCPPDSDYDGSLFQRDSELGNEIFSLLPPLSEAIRLCTRLFRERSFSMTYYTASIDLSRSSNPYRSALGIYLVSHSSFDSLECYHSLSLLFVVFALASLFDPDLPSRSIQSQEYFFLSKAALGFNPPHIHTTLKCVWCMVHLAQFLEFSDWEAMGSTAGWSYVGHAVRMGSSVRVSQIQRIIIHSADVLPFLSPTTTTTSNNRSDYTSTALAGNFQMNSSRGDTVYSGHYLRQIPGRAFTTVARHLYHTPMLTVHCPKIQMNLLMRMVKENQDVIHYWSWQFTAFMHSVMEQIFGSSRPAYNAIIDFDRKIRDFPIPTNLRIQCGDLESRPEVYMQRLIILSYKENTLMHLHRAYFAQALQDSPDNLTTHKYVASVIATYRSAWRLSRSVQFAWQSIPQLLARYHLAWSQVLSAAIVMCILVTRAPNSKMTKSSIDELGAIATLFEEAAPMSRSAGNIVDTMRNLLRKAQEAASSASSLNGTSSSDGSPTDSPSSSSRSSPEHSAASSGHSPSSCNASFTNTAELDETQDHPLSTFELDRLGGRTHLITACRKPPAREERLAAALVPDTHQPTLSLPAYPSSSPSSQTSLHSSSSTPFHHDQHDHAQQQEQLFTAESLHPAIARDIRNIDIDMDLGGMEFHFFDPPAEKQTSTQGDSSLFNSLTNGSAPSSHTADSSASTSVISNLAEIQFGDIPMGSVEMQMHFNAIGDTNISGLGSVDGTFGHSSMFGTQQPSTGAFSGFGHPQANAQLPLPFNAPILDATWQSFVEQLGF
ncbi:hypothetical protein D9757_006516 [Collybiopsis confluens]|uniref:Transcription factor domain-containing protein n=1 Tax=Collybiopsis confluens TaxID=2823264 RepID=A0A8H5HQB6_9AGAR|nr:hypothetical protein D9757_006516 [Collybiopsis confluens]